MYTQGVIPAGKVGLNKHIITDHPNQLLRVCSSSSLNTSKKPFKSPYNISCKAAAANSPQLLSHHTSKRKDDFHEHGWSETIVGVLGGGDLARLLCQAALQMGIKVNVLDPNEHCPASALAHYHMVGNYNDGATVEEFAKTCGALTIETEHVDVATIEKLEAQGIICQPKASTIRIIQDKYLQKVHFHSHDIPVPKFMQIDDLKSAKRAGELFGYPLMIRIRRLASDGISDAIAESEENISSAVNALGGYVRGLFAEQFVKVDKELAVILARGCDDSVGYYHVVETIRRDNICHIIKAPANTPSWNMDVAVDFADRAVSSLDGALVFAVQLFLTTDGKILLNEVAPGPHNSGNHTIESCYTSQYENHLRAILGLPLGHSDMKVPAAIMCNILGEEEGEAGFNLARHQIQRALSISQASFHWYDKQDIQNTRKMGHFTIVGRSMGEIETQIDSLLKEEDLDVQLPVEPRIGIVMGSDRDRAVMEDARQILDIFGIPYEFTTISAEPTSDSLPNLDYTLYAETKGFEVIIAGDSGDAHLPGMLAAKTPLPVIGVPICHLKPGELDSVIPIMPPLMFKGIYALLSIAQRPKGAEVATVGINNATSAALLAIRILALYENGLDKRLCQYLKDMKKE